MYQTILLPTDGSLNSKRAGIHALKLADSTGKLVILHVIEGYNLQTGVLPVSTLPSADESLFEDLEKEGKRILLELEDYLHKECPDKCSKITLTREIRIGKPYLEILKAMNEENVDLLVMGASGRHGLDRVILGSVTERVVREATSPIMIIP
jgi:nucleotide-binding universal stress UspA family protein